MLKILTALLISTFIISASEFEINNGATDRSEIQELKRSIAVEELIASKHRSYIVAIEDHYPSDQRDAETTEYLTDLRQQLTESEEKLGKLWAEYKVLSEDQEKRIRDKNKFVGGENIKAKAVVSLEDQWPPTAKERLFNSSAGLEGFMDLKDKEDANNQTFHDQLKNQNASSQFSKKLEEIANASDQRIYSIYYAMEQQHKRNPFSQLPPPPAGYEEYAKIMQENAIKNNPNVAIDAKNAAGSETENNLQMAKELRDLAAQETNPEKKRLYIEEAKRLESGG